MGNITVSKKLELTRQIRSRYQQDRIDMRNREQLLYGRTSISQQDERHNEFEENALDSEGSVSTLPLRLLIAAGLFMVIVLCDKSGGKFIGLSAEHCFQAISTDYESSIAVWADTAFQTENNHDKNYPPAGSRP